MNKEDRKIVRKIRKQIKKHSEFKFFVASKRGGNATGRGANRSVILAQYDNKLGWGQFAKVWGENNEQRAYQIITEAKQVR